LGSRLLEQSVLVFLQARDNINKDSRNTLYNDPELFFAYKNIVTASAEEVTTAIVAGIPAVTEIKNLQIVSGGQTSCGGPILPISTSLAGGVRR
jgi:hypothetical protein